MSLSPEVKAEAEKLRLPLTKTVKEYVHSSYAGSARELIKELQEAVKKLGVEDATLEAEYDHYDEPQTFKGFCVYAYVDKTEAELVEEIKMRKQHEERIKEREYKQYLQLKEKFDKG